MYQNLILFKVITFYTVCVIADKCQQDYMLTMGSSYVYYRIPSVEACVSLCMTEKRFLCRSVVMQFFSQIGACYMHKNDRYTSPDTYIFQEGLWYCTVGAYCPCIFRGSFSAFEVSFSKRFPF